jgi:hypothetical protein
VVADRFFDKPKNVPTVSATARSASKNMKSMGYFGYAV